VGQQTWKADQFAEKVLVAAPFGRLAAAQPALPVAVQFDDPLFAGNGIDQAQRMAGRQFRQFGPDGGKAPRLDLDE